MFEMNVLRISCVFTLALTMTGCSGGGSTVTTSTALSNGATTDSAPIVDSAAVKTQSAIVKRLLRVGTNSVSISEMPRSSDAFVDSVGVNTHFHFMGTPYVDSYPQVRNLLIGLGTRHLRDTMALDLWQPYFDHLSELAANGIHADLITQLNEPTAQITGFPAHAPNVLEAIEAPNEMNLSGDANWVADTQAYQKVLYAAVKGSSATSSLPVLGPSLTSYEAYQAVGNLSAYCDRGNMHDYFAANNPGNAGGTPFSVGKYGSIPFFMGSAQLVSGSKPVTTTETGYEENPVNPTPVSSAVKVRYSMRTLLEQWNVNVARTYFYELLDEGNQSYGLLNSDLTPKPAYTALKNLLDKLRDPTSAMPLQPLTYSLSASPLVHHTLLQKNDGSYRLMLWVETPAVDPVVPTQPVIVTTSAKYGTVRQYQWQDDGSYQTVPLTQGADGSIALSVTDRVTELKLQK